MKHKKKNEIKLGKTEEFTEDVYPNNGNALSVVVFWLQILEQVSVVHFA